MSMSKKIFGVVLLLSVVTLAITGVAVYGISQIRASTEELALAAERATSLTRVNRVNWQRTAATLRTIIYTDPSLVDAVLQNDFPSLEKEFAGELQVQRDATPPTEPDDVRRRPDELQKLWNTFAAASGEVAAMARINSNTTALNLIEEECNPLRLKEEELFIGALAPINGLDQVTVPMQATSTEICELILVTEQRLTDAAMQRLDARIRQVDAALPAYDIPQEHRAAWQQLLDTWTKHKDVIARIKTLAVQNTNEQAMTLYEQKLTPAQAAFTTFTSAASAAARQTRDVSQASATALGRQVTLVTLIVAIAGIIVAGALAYWIVSRIVKQLNVISDSLGEASVQVASAATAISESSQGLAEGATEQAASLEETSSALEQMASMTRQNADNATRTSKSTGHTVQLIEDGAKAVGNMTGAMSEISDSAEKISNIIKTIEEIAFQTNLLALNAAVEAARAGEAGKGFAVVADEVRNLAQRSAGAARDTASLIEGTVVRVKNGSEIATELDSSFKEINDGAREVGTLIGEITTATNEQAQGVDQVNTAVAQMDKVTQSNAASAEECASAAEQLSGQAESLKGVVQELVALVTGDRGAVINTGPVSSGRAPRRALPAPSSPRRAPGNAPVSAKPRPQLETSSGPQKVMRPSEVIPLDDEDGF